MESDACGLPTSFLYGRFRNVLWSLLFVLTLGSIESNYYWLEDLSTRNCAVSVPTSRAIALGLDDSVLDY